MFSNIEDKYNGYQDLYSKTEQLMMSVVKGLMLNKKYTTFEQVKKDPLYDEIDYILQGMRRRKHILRKECTSALIEEIEDSKELHKEYEGHIKTLERLRDCEEELSNTDNIVLRLLGLKNG